MYRSTSDLPLDLFIDCICDTKLEKLIISGNPSREELQKAWDIIYDDFVYKMQDEDGKYLQKLVHELNIIRTDINTVETIVKFLEFLLTAKIKVDIEALVNKLNKYTGLHIILDQANKDQCYSSLQAVLGISKLWYVESENIKQQINQSISVQDNHGALDRDYFDHILVTLSIAQKFKVNRKETTVGEFVVMVQSLRKSISDKTEFSNN